MSTPKFAVLCIAEREESCTKVLAELPFRFRLVVRPRDLMRSCVEGDVIGALVDTVSALRVGIHEMAAIYDMGINMPVLRVSGWEAGEPVAMCNAPFKKMALLQALTQIAAEEPSWNHPLYPRRNLRVPLPSRVLINPGQPDEVRGYCSNASIGGAYVMTWEPPKEGTLVTVRLLDLPFPMECQAQVRRSVTWEQPSTVPGCGLIFTTDQIPDAYRHLIADVHFRRLAGGATAEVTTDIPNPSTVFPT
ncbi:MAG: hypothetical protein RL318_1396 [Fibrobacterota bacterium]|jgi:hypothetical protein